MPVAAANAPGLPAHANGIAGTVGTGTHGSVLFRVGDRVKARRPASDQLQGAALASGVQVHGQLYKARVVSARPSAGLEVRCSLHKENGFYEQKSQRAYTRSLLVFLRYHCD